MGLGIQEESTLEWRQRHPSSTFSRIKGELDNKFPGDIFFFCLNLCTCVVQTVSWLWAASQNFTLCLSGRSPQIMRLSSTYLSILDNRRKLREKKTVDKIVPIHDSYPEHHEAFEKASWKVNELGMRKLKNVLKSQGKEHWPLETYPNGRQICPSKIR